MHNYLITKGTTNVSVELRIVDSTDGTPETGVVWNTSGIDLQYRRDGAASTAITEATLAALTTAHTDGGFLHIGNGVYRFDLPDAACASGVDKVVVHGTVTGMVVIGCVIQLTDVDLFDSVRGGMTALPNAAADAAGGLATSAGGATGIDDLATPTNITAGTITTTTNLTNNNDKTGYSLSATGLDAISQAATGMVEIAKAVWDRLLTGGTHNINNSAGKRLRQIDAAFEVHSGTAQAGAATTITLDTGASATDNIYRGDRCMIVEGTGIGEHDIITAYNGTTKVATVAETWVITPDATSEFVLVPASVDVETWQHTTVSNGATSALPVVDAQAISDNTTAADSVQSNIGNLDAPISTAQTDLDTITGSDGVTIASTQGNSITFQPIEITAGDAIPNITLSGSGTEDGVSFTRSGSGNPYDATIMAQLNAEIDTAISDADIATETKQDIIDTVVDNLNLGIIYSSAATGALSTTQATSNLSGYADDQLIGRVMVVTSGNAEGEATDITDYANVTGLLTFTALTTAMANGDTFKIV